MASLPPVVGGCDVQVYPDEGCTAMMVADGRAGLHHPKRPETHHARSNRRSRSCWPSALDGLLATNRRGSADGRELRPLFRAVATVAIRVVAEKEGRFITCPEVRC